MAHSESAITPDAAACQALHRELTKAGKPELAAKWLPMPAISRDGNVMLRALEHMRVLGWWAQLQSPFRDGQPWHCGFTPLDCWNGRPDWEESGDTAPEAVARAVVAALGGDSEC